jgi:hypothetical protein
VTEYAVPLILTTPHMTGQNVKDAQWLMAGNSRFPGLATYKDGKPDGDYGRLSEQATERAKFWVGYPLSACNGVFGQTLYEYLRPEHWRELPKDYRTRRAERLAAAAQTPGTKAITLARGEIGTHEDPPYSNRTKYGAWFRFDGVPWCAEFESWAFAHTGWSKFKFASVEQIYESAKWGRNQMRLVFTPKHGDIVCYRIHGDEFAHTAFYDEPVDADTFWDLGGNTSATDMANGGEVARQQRQLSVVSHFVRVG